MTALVWMTALGAGGMVSIGLAGVVALSAWRRRLLVQLDELEHEGATDTWSPSGEYATVAAPTRCLSIDPTAVLINGPYTPRHSMSDTPTSTIAPVMEVATVPVDEPPAQPRDGITEALAEAEDRFLDAMDDLYRGLPRWVKTHAVAYYALAA